MTSWIDYWNGDHPIYVNERHKVLHYRLLARDLAGLVPDDDAVVLDFGCGEALSADILAGKTRRLTLSDAAPAVRDKLAARFAGHPRIAVLSDHEAFALPAALLFTAFRGFSTAVGVNTAIMAGASFGWLAPVVSSVLHNGTTVALLLDAVAGGTRE